MVIAGFRGVARTFGSYSGVRVSSEFVQQVTSLFNQGIGTTEARSLLRGAGFRFRDSAFNAVRNEIRLTGIRGSRLDSLRLDARPSVNTLTQTNREYRRNFFYTATARVRDPVTGSMLTIPAEFGDDRLLTRAEIIERVEAIIEQTILNSPDACIMEGSLIENVHLTGAMVRARR